jgi:hypothetical protein
MKQVASRARPLDHEDGAKIFLWNISLLSAGYIAVYPRI